MRRQPWLEPGPTASPEQFSTRTLDQRSDLYSLGIILYAMLCSRRPFAANNLCKAISASRTSLRNHASDFIPEIPTLLEDICLKLLEKSPQDRFQSANEILSLLGEVEPGTQQIDAKNTLAQVHFWTAGCATTYWRSFMRHSFGCFEILGEEGYGKSRLMRGLGKRFRQLGVHGHQVTFPVRENVQCSDTTGPAHRQRKGGSQQLAQTLLLFSRQISQLIRILSTRSSTSVASPYRHCYKRSQVS